MQFIFQPTKCEYQSFKDSKSVPSTEDDRKSNRTADRQHKRNEFSGKKTPAAKIEMKW